MLNCFEDKKRYEHLTQVLLYAGQTIKIVWVKPPVKVGDTVQYDDEEIVWNVAKVYDTLPGRAVHDSHNTRKRWAASINDRMKRSKS